MKDDNFILPAPRPESDDWPDDDDDRPKCFACEGELNFTLWVGVSLSVFVFYILCVAVSYLREP